MAAVAETIGLAPGDPLATLDRMARRVAVARSAAEDRLAARHHLQARADARTAATARLRTAERALAGLLDAAGVATIDDLRAAGTRTAAAVELSGRIDGFERAVVVAAGEAGAARLRTALAAADPTGWEAERRELAGTQVLGEEQRDHVVAEAAELRRRLAELEQSGDVAAATLEVAGIRGELRSVLRRWMVLGLARGLISETLARYQRERQPRVLARAQELFALVTDGRYPSLRTEDRSVVAVDRAGRDVVASGLSRGTREQLYLCLRFALAESFAERASLPILLDDVLVNFDPDRAAAVATVVAAVAERHQVLAFTCHPWVRDLLLAAAASVTEVPLEATTGALIPIHHGPSTAGGTATA